ncbi:hypothetical protein CY658_21730 [Variovorax sp. RO1]|uniref:hypothetical protein n=1 Tax=Variovorax sp. RO1 TaxID=2066034 RepID=UPI000C7184BA|nr:hypothetical protein [Variovorax sp. RO1]PLC03439.1 hypothetical protein CY658_21730 [Variovorax sp. RO1]
MSKLSLTTGNARTDAALESLINAYGECARIIRCDGKAIDQVRTVASLIANVMVDLSSESEVDKLFSDVPEIVEANRRLYIEEHDDGLEVRQYRWYLGAIGSLLHDDVVRGPLNHERITYGQTPLTGDLRTDLPMLLEEYRAWRDKQQN